MTSSNQQAILKLKPSDEFFSHFRFSQLGKNAADDEYLCLQCIEFFGSVKDLLHEITSIKPVGSIAKTIDFPFSANTNENASGVLQYLSTLSVPRVAESFYLSSSPSKENHFKFNIFLNDQSVWTSDGVKHQKHSEYPNGNICISFKGGFQFRPSGYKIKFGDRLIPKSWKITGRMDDYRKIVLSTPKNETSSLEYFSGPISTNEYFICFDIFQTNLNFDGTNSFSIAYLEFFGTLKRFNE